MGLKISDLIELSWSGNNDASKTYFPIVLNNGLGLVNRKFALSSVWDIIENNVKSICEQYKSVYNFGGGGGSEGSSQGGGLTDEQIALINTNTLNISALQTAYSLLEAGVNNNSSNINLINSSKFWIKLLDPSNTVTAVYSYSPSSGLLLTNESNILNNSRVVSIVSGYIQNAKYRYLYNLSASAVYIASELKYLIGVGTMSLSKPLGLQTSYLGGTITPMEMRVSPSWGGLRTITISPTSVEDASGQYTLSIDSINADINYLDTLGGYITIVVLFGSFQSLVTLYSTGSTTVASQTGDIT